MLKSSGFRVVATALSQASVPISDVDWTQPTAVIFGNEKDGGLSSKRGLLTSAAAHPRPEFRFANFKQSHQQRTSAPA